MSEKLDSNTRIVAGRVVSDKAAKTIVVLVERRVRHPLYAKYMRRSTRIATHDEQGQARTGDYVEIAECRPISKRKSWRLVRVVGKVGELEAAGQ